MTRFRTPSLSLATSDDACTCFAFHHSIRSIRSIRIPLWKEHQNVFKNVFWSTPLLSDDACTCFAFHHSIHSIHSIRSIRSIRSLSESQREFARFNSHLIPFTQRCPETGSDQSRCVTATIPPWGQHPAWRFVACRDCFLGSEYAVCKRV
jgi:hypothetical protein